MLQSLLYVIDTYHNCLFCSFLKLKGGTGLAPRPSGSIYEKSKKEFLISERHDYAKSAAFVTYTGVAIGWLAAGAAICAFMIGLATVSGALL